MNDNDAEFKAVYLKNEEESKNEKKPIIILITNARSISNKMHKIEATGYFCKAHILCISEMWTKPGDKIDKFGRFVEVTQLPREKKDGRGGGAGVFATKEVHALVRHSMSTDYGIEGLQVNYVKFDELTLIHAYRSPSQNVQSCKESLQKLVDILLDDESENFAIVGDINCEADWENYIAKYSRCNDFVENMKAIGMRSLIDQYTYVPKKTTPDVVLCSNDCNMKKVEIDYCNRLSDHANIVMSVELEKEYEDNEEDDYYLDHDKINLDLYNELLGEVDWASIVEIEDVDEMMESISQTIRYCYLKAVPPKRKRKMKSDSLLTREARDTIKEIRRLKIDGNKPAIKRQEKKLNRILKGARSKQIKEFVKKLEENKKDLYKAMAMRSKKEQITAVKREDGTLATDPEEVAEIFAKEFAKVYTEPRPHDINWDIRNGTLIDHIQIDYEDVKQAIEECKSSHSTGLDEVSNVMLKKGKKKLIEPLMAAFRIIMTKSKIPKSFKMAKIRPIPKKSDSSIAQNNRPINQCSCIGKILERIVTKQIVGALEENNRLNDRQYGFRKGKSTDMNLLRFYNYVSDALSKNIAIDILYLDFSRAFDKVCGAVVLEKLHKMGIRGQVGKYYEDWFKDRLHFVKIKDKLSSGHRIDSGILQGSVAGPSLFNILLDDIFDEIINQDNEDNEANKDSLIIAYADDTKLAMKVPNKRECRRMQEDITRISNWADRNMMSFNVNKCDILHLGRRNLKHVYRMNGVDIGEASSVRDLGLIVQDDLSFKKHIEKTADRVSKLAKAIKRRLRGSSYKTHVFVWKVYLAPILEYASVIYSTTEIKDMNALNIPYKEFFTNRRPKSNDETPLTPVQRVIIKDLEMMHRLSHGEGEIDVSEELGKQKHHNTRYAGRKYDVQPKRHEGGDSKKLMFRRKKEWEKVPHEIREGPRPDFMKYITDATFLEEYDIAEIRKKLMEGKLKNRYTWCRQQLKNVERDKKAETAEQRKTAQRAP